MANEVQKLTPHQQNVVSFRQMAESPAYANRFRQVLNERAPQFIASLTQLVSGSSYLAECDPNTIMAAAITSAALDLPIDKNLGFAHIVPYKGKAQFQLGYKGFIQLAVRSGQYKFLNCCLVKKGELQKYDELTGEVVIDQSKRESEDVIGYAAYFKLMNGYEHAEYWTKKEVDDHARRFSQAYSGKYETPWKTDFDSMAMKTVIKSLLAHWGIMSITMQTAVINDQGVRKNIDSDEVAYPDNESEPKRPAQDSPPIDVASTASAIDAAPVLSGDALTKAVVDLCNKDGVTEPQLIAYCKSVKPPLCQPQTIEIMGLSDETLRLLHINWKNILKNVKATKTDTLV